MTTEHITPEQAVELADRSGLLGCELSEFEGKLHAFALAAIAWGREQRAKELPVLPQGYGSIPWAYRGNVFIESQLKAYGAACAAHAREMALSEAAKVAAATVCDTHIPTGVQIYGSRAGKAIEALKGK